MPRTVLVTVTYNGVQDWDEFLAGVLGQDDPDWGLVVVDNASHDGTVERLRDVDDPRVHIVLNDENLGVAAANNQGIRLALEEGAESVLIINNDTVLPPGLVRALQGCAKEQDAAMVTPLIAYDEDRERIWYGGGTFLRRGGVRNDHTNWSEPVAVVGAQPFETGYAPTTCLLVAREVFERIGMMDERYFVYWDDADFVWRARTAGFRLVLDPRAVMYHKVSTSTGGMTSDFSIRYMHRNQMLFTRKFHGPWWTAYTAFEAMRDGVVRVLKGRDRPRQAAIRARAIVEGLRVAA
jgi:GT2 family glycosyltransferase